MDGLLRSARYALRQLWHAPIFSLAAILTLALGIGGTTAVFTLIHAVMLKSLPVVDPESLYRIGDGVTCCVQGSPQEQWGIFSYQLAQRLAAESPEFEQVAIFQGGQGRFSVRRERVDTAARPLRSEYVSGNYFTTLGIGAFGGRLLTPDDDTPASPPAVVMSYHTWSGAYGADESIVGSALMIDGHAFTVVGITPPGFFGETLKGDPADLYIPLNQETTLAGASALINAKSAAWLRAIGRLKPGATTAGMDARLTAILRQWMEFEAGYPANWDIKRTLDKQTLRVIPAGSGIGVMEDQYGRSLKLLLGVCGLVLLIACANVANLLLTRAVARRQQTAVKLAMGASRGQIVGHALLESVMLSIAGGIAGVAVAVGAANLLLGLAFSNVRFLPINTSPSIPMLAFAFGLSLATGVLFGVVPAWHATRTNPIEAMRGAGRSIGDKSSKTRTVLLVAQATLSVVLVAGAMLLARSLNQLENQQFGYELDGRIVIALNRLPADYPPERLTALYRQMDERLKQLPGVKGAGMALYNPLTDNWGELVLVAGHPPPSINENAGTSWDRVTPDYLQNFGIPLVRGRYLTAADTEQTVNVAVVNETFAKRFFKSDEDPIGQHFGFDLPENVNTYQIVGIVKDSKFVSYTLRRDVRPMMWVSLGQTVAYESEMMKRIERASRIISGVMLVTDAPPGQMEPLVRQVMADIDPNLTVNTVRTMRQQVELAFNQERAVAALAGLFGVVALLLAAVGLYGVTAYSVAQRTNEIGVRMALGADRQRVIGLVMRGAFLRVLAGLLLGIPLAIGAGKLAAAQLYQVKYWDPSALATATVALAICGFLAALTPAARAAAISPMRALRTE